jgi:hypothetical protein
MPAILPEATADYAVLGPGGAQVGREQLVVARAGLGWKLTSQLRTRFPVEIAARLEWELDAGLQTRLLVIASDDGFGAHRELELTVTGNGMLAHRTGPDGPSQVELGWGPRVELDFISAAFPIVTMARQGAAVAGVDLSTVYIGLEDLEPVVVERRWSPVRPGVITVSTPATGHIATLTLRADGLLEDYSGLLRLAPG